MTTTSPSSESEEETKGTAKNTASISSPPVMVSSSLPAGSTSSSSSSHHSNSDGGVAVSRKRRVNPKATFDASSPQIKQDILKMIALYLSNEGYHASALTVQDEISLKTHMQKKHQAQLRRIHKAIVEGDYDAVRKLATKQLLKKSLRPVLYAVFRQEYLELIERQEYQRAFIFLTKRLKPLENVSRLQGNPREFSDLCYLLTCRSVRDVPAFAWFEGVKSSREALGETFQSMVGLALDGGGNVDQVAPLARDPDADRLVGMLQQAVAYQVEFSPSHAQLPSRVDTLLRDFQHTVVPNAQACTYEGHSRNVKCVTFCGRDGDLLASGSSDNAVMLWSSDAGNNTGRPIAKLTGHTARVWDVSSDPSGRWLASASETVRLWDIENIRSEEFDSMEHSSSVRLRCGHDGDVYSATFHPGGQHLVTAGYDKTARLVDVRAGKVIKAFHGHGASVAHAAFNPVGNLIVTASKDSTVKFWDVLSGVCVRTFSQLLAEVTSVQIAPDGQKLLAALKDNSNRIWDLRSTSRNELLRFKGHQNTSKNFIRARFGLNGSLVLSGSEDGRVHVWDARSGNLLERLRGHIGSVYRAEWNAHLGLVASCSDDGTVKTWSHKPVNI